MSSEQKTLPEVDALVGRLEDWLETEAQIITLTRHDVSWLVGEIIGGREAFGALVETNAALRGEQAKMRRTVDLLLECSRMRSPAPELQKLFQETRPNA